MPTFLDGKRSIDGDALAQFPDPMTEVELAGFMGIGKAHARRRRLDSVKAPRTWPTVSHRRVEPTKARASVQLAVCYRHSAVRKWMRGLERVES